jgi:hypothetical protein
VSNDVSNGMSDGMSDGVTDDVSDSVSGRVCIGLSCPATGTTHPASHTASNPTFVK